MGEGDSTGEKKDRIMPSVVRRELPRNCLCCLAPDSLCGLQNYLLWEPQEDPCGHFQRKTEARGVQQEALESRSLIFQIGDESRWGNQSHGLAGEEVSQL